MTVISITCQASEPVWVPICAWRDAKMIYYTLLDPKSPKHEYLVEKVVVDTAGNGSFKMSKKFTKKVTFELDST